MNRSIQFDRFEDAETASRAIVEVITRAGRDIAIHTRVLDELIWERPAVIAALRTYMTDRTLCNVRVLVDEPKALSVGNTHFMALAQRLSSHIQLREPDPDEAQLDHEFVVTDREGLVKWDLGSRHRGEFAIDAPARSHTQLQQFNHVWERARACQEFRSVGF